MGNIQNPIKQLQKQTNNDNNNDDNKEEKKESLSQTATIDIKIPKVNKLTLITLPNEVRKLYQHKAKYEINKNGSCTFYPTPNCEPSTSKINSSKISMDKTAKRNDCNKIEAFSNPNKQVIGSDTTMHSFISSSVTAWSEHYPFRFKCEHIWLLVLQAVAVNVDKNAEKLRSKYVEHEGKKELEIRRDNFVLGSPDNDWEGVIEEFVEQIDKNTVNDTVELLECDFSSSTLTERIAVKITIMDICKNYFAYTMSTCCGFPSITLDGNKNDWIRLKQKCVKLLNEKVEEKWGAEWSKSLIPLLDRFIVAFDGDIDCAFWNSMIKSGATGGSGGKSWISGWFNILFPYLDDNKYNKFCVPYSMSNDYVKQGLKISVNWTKGHEDDKYPLGFSSAPVTWKYLGKKLELKFIAGFIGYQQNVDDKSLELCPNIDWCIAHKMSEKEIKEKSNDPWDYL